MAIWDYMTTPSFDLQQHFDNTQLLKNAVASGDITNEQNNQMSGYDTTQTMGGVFDQGGGLGRAATQGLGSLAYNVVQSATGDQPWSEIYGDVYRNIQGARGLPTNLLNKYNTITYQGPGFIKGGVDSSPVLQNQGGGNQGGGNQGGGGYAAGQSGSSTGIGQSGGFAGSGLTSAPTPRGPDLRNRANGGIVSLLWPR